MTFSVELPSVEKMELYEGIREVTFSSRTTGIKVKDFVLSAYVFREIEFCRPWSICRPTVCQGRGRGWTDADRS